MSKSARDKSRKKRTQNDSKAAIRARSESLRHFSDEELLSGLDKLHKELKEIQLEKLLLLVETKRRRI